MLPARFLGGRLHLAGVGAGRHVILGKVVVDHLVPTSMPGKRSGKEGRAGGSGGRRTTTLGILI